MLDHTSYPFCQEFYIVEKSIEVVVLINGEPETIRIDALHRPSESRYSARSYIKQSVTVQPTYPQANGQFSRVPEDIEVWADYDLPWTARESADDVIVQALSFLKERCTK